MRKTLGLLQKRRAERGAILVHVAVSLVGLLAFSAFTIDYGVMMVSRAQAQNAADAAAMAAALYLAWDDPTDQAGAQQSGVAAAQQNWVWGQAPDVVDADITFPNCPPGAPGPVDMCVRANVFRNQRPGGSPLPVFFSSLVGVGDQGVQATATAQVLFGSGTGPFDCIKPFAIPDRWDEFREDETGTLPADDDGTAGPDFPQDEAHGNDWDADDSYDAYYSQGGNRGQPLPGAVDIFNAGTTGYELTPNPQSTVEANDHGIQLQLKQANGSNVAPSWYYPYVIDDGCGTGASCYRDRISGCATSDLEEGDTLQNEPGNMIGPTAQGVADLIAQDPAASFVVNGTHPRGTVVGGMGMASPRLAAVPTFDPEIYMQGHQNGRIDAGDAEIIVTGIVGIFFDRIQGNTVYGHVMPIDFDPTPDNLTDDTSSFLRTVILVR